MGNLQCDFIDTSLPEEKGYEAVKLSGFKNPLNDFVLKLRGYNNHTIILSPTQAKKLAEWIKVAYCEDEVNG